MVKRFKNLLFTPQSSVFSAATIIMVMIVVAQLLGVVRQRILLEFFTPHEYAVFLAAFRLPDLVFEVFAFGAFSSAFIPVFTKSLRNQSEKEAWGLASRVISIGLLIFVIFAAIFSIFAPNFYSFVTPGFSAEDIQKVSMVARIIFAAQGVFLVSYVITGVLESMKRFLVPALAPVFYNLGIIVGTLLFADSLGIYAPVVGVILGAVFHLGIQLPFAIWLGFRFRPSISVTPEVKQIGKLALPRFFELSFLQVLKTTELALASFLSTASYTYLTLANSLQMVPIGLLGISLAKAALPTLTQQSDDPSAFKKTFSTTLYQMMFFTIPLATVLVVLRIPIVRIIYGTDMFDWEATVQTGLVLSAFALGIPFQAALALLSRAFYALHDTRTPVMLAIFDVVLTLCIEIPLVIWFGLPVWAIGAANTVAAMVQVSFLYYILGKKVNGGALFTLKPIVKSVTAAASSGFVMFAIIKFFDRSVWVKKLSFLGLFDNDIPSINFERFVLDTRYAGNLVFLTFITAILGGLVYIFLSFVFRSQELNFLIKFISTRGFAKAREKELEPLASSPIDTP